MRSLIVVLVALAAAPTWALEGPAPAAAPAAATAPHAGNSRNVQLGKIQVHSDAAALVKALQEIRLAVKRPFDNDPGHFDDMVCRFGQDLGTHAGTTLECGTQGWFGMRRNDFGYGGVMQGSPATSVTLGHPWHVVRQLNSHQVQVMRDLLRELPPPGQGDVRAVDDTAPVVPAIDTKH